MKYACPVCFRLVFNEPNGKYDICPVCCWEDDPHQFHEASQEALGANGNVSLNKARENYRRHRISDPSPLMWALKIFRLRIFKRYKVAKEFKYSESVSDQSW